MLKICKECRLWLWFMNPLLVNIEYLDFRTHPCVFEYWTYFIRYSCFYFISFSAGSIMYIIVCWIGRKVCDESNIKCLYFIPAYGNSVFKYFPIWSVSWFYYFPIWSVSWFYLPLWSVSWLSVRSCRARPLQYGMVCYGW